MKTLFQLKPIFRWNLTPENQAKNYFHWNQSFGWSHYFWWKLSENIISTENNLSGENINWKHYFSWNQSLRWKQLFLLKIKWKLKLKTLLQLKPNFSGEHLLQLKIKWKNILTETNLSSEKTENIIFAEKQVKNYYYNYWLLEASPDYMDW
jgi:hypothetical protein